MPQPYLSIVFPAYNESRRLPRSLRAAADFLESGRRSFEIIVVDDGSGDGTADAAEQSLRDRNIPLRIIRLEQNRGKGFAVKTGFQAALGQFVFFSDADLSTPIEEMEKMLPLLERGCHVVIGSRAMRGSSLEVRQPLLREYSGRMFNIIVQALLLRGIKDTQCGFKGFRGDSLPAIASRMKLTGFSFDLEILWIARRLGYSISEIPVRWRNDPDSRVSFFRDVPRMLIDLVRIRFMHRNHSCPK